MKVKTLIEKLQAMDPEMYVIIPWSDDCPEDYVECPTIIKEQHVDMSAGQLVHNYQIDDKDPDSLSKCVFIY